MVKDNHIMVSVCCLTYNHKSFIKNALDSFLMQKTNFPIEIIVHDDASTDGTAEILREYANKYPHLIKPVFQTENCFSRGEVFSLYTKYIFPKARGKYLAFCEGDDYWINPNKLQIQFDYMEQNVSCVMATHNVYHEDAESGQRTLHYKHLTTGEYSASDALTEFPHIPHTTSMFCRAEMFKRIPECFLYSPVPDVPMMLQCLTCGNIYYLEEAMSVWRYAHSTSWTFSMRQDTRAKQYHYLQMLKLYNQFDKNIGGRFNVPLARNIQRTLRSILILEAFGIDECLCDFHQWLDQNNDYEDQIREIKSCGQVIGFEPVWNHARNAVRNGCKLFIYGAGVYGSLAAKTMQQIDLPLQGFIISDGQSKENVISHAPVYYRSELPYAPENIWILIAMESENAKEVMYSFDKLSNICYPFSYI